MENNIEFRCTDCAKEFDYTPNFVDSGNNTPLCDECKTERDITNFDYGDPEGFSYRALTLTEKLTWNKN